MNKAEIVSALVRRTGLTVRKAEEVVGAFTDIMSEALSAGEKVKLVGFGVFEPKKRAPRLARDLTHNTTVHVPSKTVVVFQVGSDLNKKLNTQNSN